MSGPHKPWAGRQHSDAMLARIRKLWTLEDAAQETAAQGTPLSVSQISRMEREGAGSDGAWLALAKAVGEPVERIRPTSPAGGNFAEPQLLLPGTTSS